MGDASVMQVVKAFGNLLEQSSASGLRNLSVYAALLDELVQRDATDVVCYNGDLFRGLDEIVHPNYVGVINLLES